MPSNMSLVTISFSYSGSKPFLRLKAALACASTSDPPTTLMKYLHCFSFVLHTACPKLSTPANAENTGTCSRSLSDSCTVVTLPPLASLATSSSSVGSISNHCRTLLPSGLRSEHCNLTTLIVLFNCSIDT